MGGNESKSRSCSNGMLWFNFSYQSQEISMHLCSIEDDTA